MTEFEEYLEEYAVVSDKLHTPLPNRSESETRRLQFRSAVALEGMIKLNPNTTVEQKKARLGLLYQLNGWNDPILM